MTASSMQLNRETLPLEEDELARLSRKAPTEIIHSGHFMVSDIDDADNTDEVARASESDCATEVPGSLAAPLAEAVEEISFDPDEGMEVDKHLKPPCHIAIDGSLTKLFECMTLAYSGKLTSPKWKTFKGLKLRLKDKIRLNNIIWRAWHMQFVARRSPYVCQFASPLEGDTHNKPEAIVMEGKYWKRNFDNITAEYKKWRMFFCKKNSRFRTGDDSSTNPVDLDLRWLSHGGLIDEDFFMDLSESLFSSLNQPFDFPNPREIATRAGIADFIQPGLIQLQPAFEDFMDTLEPLSDYFNSKLPTLPEEGSLSAEATTVQPFGIQQQQRPASVFGASSRQQAGVANHQLQPPPTPATVQPQAPQQSPQMQPLQGQASSFAPTLSPQQSAAAAVVNSIEGLLASAAQQQQPQQPSPPAAGLGDYEFLRQAPAAPMILSVEQAAAAAPPPPQHSQVVPPGFAAQQTAQLPLAIAPRPSLATVPFGAEVPQYVPKQSIRPQPKLMPRPPVSTFQPSATELQAFARAPVSVVPQASVNGLRQSARLAAEHHAGEKVVQGGATAKRPLYPASQETMETVEGQYSSSSNLMRPLAGGFMPAENAVPATGKNMNFAMPKVATQPKSRTRSRSMSTPQSNSKMSTALATAPVAKQALSLNQLPQVNSPPQVLTPKLSVSVSSLPGSMPSNSVSPPLQQSAVLTQLLASGNGFSWEAQAAGGSNTPNSTGGAPSPPTVTIINSVAPSLPATVAQPQAFVISPVTLSQISSTNMQRNLIVGSASIMSSSMPIPSKQLNPTAPVVGQQAKATDVPAGSVSSSPAKPFRPKSDEERFQYKEHRRVCHINAEQKRRFNIKNGFESLRHLLPSLSQNPDSKVSKAQMLQQAGEYIRTLKNERQQQQEEADRLKKQIESFNQEISLYQNQLPATGVPLPCQRTNHLKESFEEYVRARTLQNWKFWVFSLLLEPLLESYNQTVSKAGFDEMCKTVLVWVEQYCSLRALRPGVLDSLKHLSKSTNILSDPSRLPEEATQAVTKRESVPQFKFSTQRRKER
ncbi:MLX interacting protein mondo isoform X1 [Rhipicephalus microplus]|uniref:MLX interacting protein mondo isoform X1 n=1 Tax=Rhipicephalus microplus TaxID=6941 RepID=UPI003F6CF771